MIEKDKCRTEFDKPTHIGASMLELGKVLMYDFHYNYIKNKYGDKAKLLINDSDSWIYEIETENVTKNFYRSDMHFFRAVIKNINL